MSVLSVGEKERERERERENKRARERERERKEREKEKETNGVTQMGQMHPDLMPPTLLWQATHQAGVALRVVGHSLEHCLGHFAPRAGIRNLINKQIMLYLKEQ